jgi:hypothetical protein
MVTFYITTQKRRFSKFDRFSKFVLIGNDIDGQVNIDIVEFDDYEGVKKMLPKMFENLCFEGEWRLNLYQVPKNWTIKYQYGYYRVPNKGKMVFEFSYMRAGSRIEIFLTNTIIHIFCLTQVFDTWSEETYGDEKKFPLDVFEDYITVELIEPIDGRKLNYDEFRGKIEEI